MSKTIHQRNKSSPSLSTLAQGGGLKPATKRSAFGDVSNTANANRPIRDDSIISTKGGFQLGEKVISLQQERKTTTALLQPAQRPQTIAGGKGLVNNVSNSTAATTSKSILIDIQPNPQPANVRKAITKRNTTIFKDAASAQNDRLIPDQNKPLPVKALTAPVHRNLDAQQPKKISETVEEPQQNLPKAQNVSNVQSKPREIVDLKSKASADIIENGIHRSDGLHVDDNSNPQAFHYTDETNLVEAPTHPPSKGNNVLAVKALENPPTVAGNSEDSTDKAQIGLARKPTLPLASEPEEYWDEEEEENYEEEGYATARSYKSKGDNTTGGATTILFPKLNVKARKEIAAAKQLIESTRTLEEIEDEAWDTTMVAEYGDEIFQYMKELEVRCGYSLRRPRTDYE